MVVHPAEAKSGFYNVKRPSTLSDEEVTDDLKLEYMLASIHV